MNRQDIYNKVRNHLLAQGKKSWVNSGSMCLYRGPNGLKCGIGAVIPDKLYKPSFEGHRIIDLLITQPALAEYLGVQTTEDRLFLAALQRIHDCVPTFEWKEALTNFAAEYGLQP